MRIRVLHALYARYLNHDTLKAPQEPWNAMVLKGLILVLMEGGLWLMDCKDLMVGDWVS